jgi:hypothetical protein
LPEALSVLWKLTLDLLITTLDGRLALSVQVDVADAGSVVAATSPVVAVTASATPATARRRAGKRMDDPFD